MVVACAGLRSAFDDLMLSQGVEAWLRGVFACNQYIDAQAPWALRKTDPERMHAVLGTLVRAIRMLAIAILPDRPGGAGRRRHARRRRPRSRGDRRRRLVRSSGRGRCHARHASTWPSRGWNFPRWRR
ncbi:hypothetical protein AB5I41_05320 [Sphingomonas sp. MMS24-JH45]